MRLKNPILMLFLAMICCLSPGCRDDLMVLPEQAQGLAPIYSQNEDWKLVSIDAPRAKDNITGTFLDGNISFDREAGMGLHVTDMADPLIPQPIAFITIPGVHSVEIRADSLIAGNYLDALVFSIADPRNITLGRRIESVHLIEPLVQLPDDFNGFFECPDRNNGDLIGWIPKEVIEPQCWR